MKLPEVTPRTQRQAGEQPEPDNAAGKRVSAVRGLNITNGCPVSWGRAGAFRTLYGGPTPSEDQLHNIINRYNSAFSGSPEKPKSNRVSASIPSDDFLNQSVK
ncbi:hypothetical protein RRG08_027481 [Elysia crispata]|uniref:Uncharacterized protein n=1 Tax=Elysia crispata TaxID=231223 RepID=A0AAE1D3P8_9GAST|nr:hypothetical protein RRG08_027481 [Elysia crispata]